MKIDNIESKIHGLSKYVKVFRFEKYLCFFNSFSLDKIFVSNKLDLTSKRVINKLKKYDLLRDFDIKADELINSKRRGFKPKFQQLYLVISEECNFNCKYCRQVIHGLRREANNDYRGGS